MYETIMNTEEKAMKLKEYTDRTEMLVVSGGRIQSVINTV